MALEQEQDRRIADVVTREESRLRRFIRRRVPDPRDVEDVLQDVFCRLVEANRLLMPIDHVTGWLYQVARNRIVDLFRGRRVRLGGSRLAMPGWESLAPEAEDDDRLLEDLLPSPEDGPDALYARTVVLEALEDALGELPPEQRDVFVAHEIEGRSFKELAEETGVNVNTLLSRKRYAVLRLRERLQDVYHEFTRG